MQSYTSSATSINSTKLPAVFRRATITAPAVLDYGCGRYTDHIKASLPDTDYLPYDPFNQPDDVNRESYNAMLHYIKTGNKVDVTCSNVLNVIDDDDTIKQIAGVIEWIVSRSGGTGYVTVYEGNRSGTGRQTGPDQYQRNEPLRNYLRFFRNARISNGMIIVGR
jgi:hypothetical protein